MIYTVTFNPALDYIVSVPEFRMGKTNRTAAEQIYPGGKGINVSIVLKNLGFESTALPQDSWGRRSAESWTVRELMPASSSWGRAVPGLISS